MKQDSEEWSEWLKRRLALVRKGCGYGIASIAHLSSSSSTHYLLNMAPKDLATWSDLPIELVDLVLAHLDPQSLLTMGRLNHCLNRLALEAFFGSSVRSIHMNKLVPPFPHPEHLIFTGLSIALWMDNITELEQRVVGDVHQSAEQFRKLIAFVQRLHSLKSLVLGIHIVPPCWRWRDYRVEGDLLLAKLHELMDIAVAKGCERLHIEGNSIPHCRLSAAGIRTLQSHDKAAEAWKWVKQRLSLSCIWNSSTSPSSSPFSGGYSPQEPSRQPDSHLTACTLHRPALLGAPALPYIAKLLKRNAETITYLDVNCFGLTSSYWKARNLPFAIFTSVYLPHLETFVLTTQVSLISTSSFALFLSRHPRISTLNIIDPATTFPDQLSMIIVKHPPINLPNLNILSVPSRVAEWLFANMTDEPHYFESVTLSALGYPSNLEKLGDAIREMRRRRGHIQTLTLDAKWWRGDLTLGQQDEPCLLNVGKLVLSFDAGHCTLTSPLQLAGAFLHVLKWLPTVTELEIKPKYEERAPDDLYVEQVKKIILERCPNLLSVQ